MARDRIVGGGERKRNILITVFCALCGKELLRTPSEVKRSARYFCNMKCLGKYHRLPREKSGFDADWLRQKYIGEGLSLVQIGALVHRSYQAVGVWLSYYDIPKRRRGRKGNEYSDK